MPVPAILHTIVDRAQRDAYIKFREGWKEGQQNKYTAIREPITDALLEAHWDGEVSIGYYPIKPGTNVVQMLCFDIDNHLKDGQRPYTSSDFEEAVKRIIESATNHDLHHPVIWQTSPNGYRVDYFWDNPQEAKLVRQLGAEISNAAGVACEVFPKQDQVVAGGLASGVSLLGGRGSTLMDTELQSIPRERWFRRGIQSNAAVCIALPSAHETRTLNDSGVVQRINAHRLKDGRNSEGYRLLVKLRCQMNFDEELLTAMAVGYEQQFGLNRGECVSMIDRVLKNQPDVIDSDFRSLTKLAPRWKTEKERAKFILDFRGQQVKIGSSTELRQWTKVMDAISDQTNHLVTDYDQRRWTPILTDLWGAMTVLRTEGESDIDAAYDALRAWLRADLEIIAFGEHWSDRERLVQGHAWLDEDAMRVYFHPDAPVTWSKKKANAPRGYDRKMMLQMLKDRGVGDRKQMTVARNRRETLYWIEFEQVEAGIEIAGIIEDQRRVERFGRGYGVIEEAQNEQKLRMVHEELTKTEF